jgi:hypothetical protein
MIPFDVVHEDLPAFDFGDFDSVLEDDPDFATFPKRSIDFPFDILITLNNHLFPHEFFHVQELFAEKVFHDDCVVVVQPVDHSCFLFLLEQLDVGFGVFGDDVFDLAVVCDSAHFLLDVHVEFVPHHMVVQ